MPEGPVEIHWGDRPQHRIVSRAGDGVYLPAGVPHLPIDTGAQTARTGLARRDPNAQVPTRSRVSS